MSILIRGLEMPKYNNEVIIRIQPDGTVLDQHGHHLNLALKAIPVPPRGRLIDADVLEAKGYCLSKLHIDYDAPAGHQVWRECVPFDEAPTIISAEEGEI